MPNRFGRDHDELRAIMHRFATYLRTGGAYDRAVLSRQRVAFSRVFGPHVVAEERSLNALSARLLDPAAIRDVATYRDSLRDLRLDYSAHISVWTPDAIERDWPQYGRAVIALQRRLFDTMAWEERVIHPLFARPAPPKA